MLDSSHLILAELDVHEDRHQGSMPIIGNEGHVLTIYLTSQQTRPDKEKGVNVGISAGHETVSI